MLRQGYHDKISECFWNPLLKLVSFDILGLSRPGLVGGLAFPMTTKTEILTLLKRNGGHSVNELAAALGLAPITIRQHLTRLERDGLVRSEQRARPAGRPHHVFQLTPKAHAATFPARTDRVVELLVREVGCLDWAELAGRTPAERTRTVLRRLAESLAEEYGSLLEGWSLEERVVFTTEVMHADGGFAEWGETEGGYEIRDFNCMFHRLVDGEQEVCEWHQSFLRRMLQSEVRGSPCPEGSTHCCRFVVEAAPAVGTEGAGGAAR